MEKKDSNDLKINENIYFPYLIKLNQFTKIINNKKYYIRLGLTSKNNISFEYYDKEDLINSYYILSLNAEEIYKLNDNFKSKKNLDELYNYISDILNKGNFDIKFSNQLNNQCLLVLLDNKDEISITLNKGKISFLNEYNNELNDFINNLCNEVLSLKKLLKNSPNINE